MKIEPDKQFPHSLATVSSIADHYSLEVLSYQEASAGIENTTLIVKTTPGDFVFRVYRQHKKTLDEIEAELDFMSYLRQAGIPIPQTITNNQQGSITVFEVSGTSWQAVVMKYMRGSHVDTLSAALLTEMATTQARMHQLAASYKPLNEATRKLTSLAETEFIQAVDQLLLSPKLQAFLRRGAAYVLPLSASLPAGLCHLDYDEQNILCEDDRITAVLDFDDLSVAPYVVCLAYTLWHVYDGGGQAALQAYMKVYKQLQPLMLEERDALHPAMLFRHYMITAIKLSDGQNSTENTRSYLKTEQYLLSLSQKAF